MTSTATARRFYTEAFTRSHGTTPRGFGRWMFTRTIWQERDGGTLTTQEFATSATYTEAKKAAAGQPLPEGFDSFSEWTVCP